MRAVPQAKLYNLMFAGVPSANQIKRSTSGMHRSVSFTERYLGIQLTTTQHSLRAHILGASKKQHQVEMWRIALDDAQPLPYSKPMYGTL